MYDDMSWEEFRAEALAYAKERNETIIKKWLDKIGYTEPIGYYCNNSRKVMEIYATRVGVLIGKAGATVNEFEKMLSDEFHGEWRVEFTEIRGGFVNV